MRDIALFLLLLGLIPVALKRPMVGVSAYVVISIMNPHQLSWSIARDFPWAMVYAVVTTVAALRWHGDRVWHALHQYRMPLILAAWTVATTIFALDVSVSMPLLITFLKLHYGVLIALICVRDMKDVRLLVAVLTASVAFYGFKGFVFMLGTAGAYRVNGPVNTMIADNNHLALALSMVVPLLYWLVSQAERKWVRVLLWTTLVGCVFSALGTYSRGGFLALAVVAAAMVARSPRKLQLTLFFIPAVAVALAFMPDAFWERMSTISEYKEDSSATGRIEAWITSFNAANDRITGAGFAFYRNALNYIAYSPPNPWPRATHSIYFQMLGDHGWIGLGLYLSVFVGALIKTSRARSHLDTPVARGYNELLRALQVSLLGFFAGGAFLSMAYWDFAYYLVAVVAAMHALRFKLGETVLPVEAAARTSRPGSIFERPRSAPGHP